MKRKLFCQISPMTYKISVLKCQALRHIQDIISTEKIAKSKQSERLPILIYSHKSWIRRTLGDVDAVLQNNKAVNLAIAAPKVSTVIIKPQEIFSFWNLVGSCSQKKGYLQGLVIHSGEVGKGIGGGMCQFTNLIHWLVLHTPLDIIEHHHHDDIDMFPDFGRQVPFGVGTSIVYNYLDYRVKNNTNITFQLLTWTDDDYLCGEMRANKSLDVKFHIKSENAYFVRENDVVYRKGDVYRECVDIHTGNIIERTLIKSNHARVMYDTTNLTMIDKSDEQC